MQRLEEHPFLVFSFFLKKKMLWIGEHPMSGFSALAALFLPLINDLIYFQTKSTSLTISLADGNPSLLLGVVICGKLSS